MSEIGNKIRKVFGSAAIFKDYKNYDVFTGRNLPSFVKDYLISSHISPDGTIRRPELIRFLDEHIPSNNNAVKSRLMQGETLTLLTRFIVTTNLAKNKTQFQIPDMGIKSDETQIPSSLVEQYHDDLIDGEKWGILKITYIYPEHYGRGYIEMINFKPFRPLEHLDIDYFRDCRREFTIDEWIDVLISAMEYSPGPFNDKSQKLEFITRLLPFIEPRLNMIELAPKGTGKSYVLGNLSKFVWLISGGRVSRAKLFYDKQKQVPGIMRFYDLVAFDEIQTISFTDGPEMQSFLKAYLEFGKTTVDNFEFMSECGLMLLGNIKLSEEGHPLNHNYFEELPINFKDSALLDRFHGFIEGWLLSRVNSDMALIDWTLNVEFFSEIMHQLRSSSIYSELVNHVISVPRASDMRHLKAVKRIATAYLKLLFPHVTTIKELNLEEFETYCLKPAIHRRDVIRQQCSYMDQEASFSKPMPAISIKECLK